MEYMVYITHHSGTATLKVIAGSEAEVIEKVRLYVEHIAKKYGKHKIDVKEVQK